MATFAQEVEQEPFDSEEFVERVAWRFTSENHSKNEFKDGGSGKNEATNTESNNESKNESKNRNEPELDPLVLHDVFVQAIRDLKALNEVTQQRIDRLQGLVAEEEKKHWQKVCELQDKNKVSFAGFKNLDERINFVATKVVHLGDQLESVNTPRSRAVEAQKLMNYFAEFLGPDPLMSEVFTDKTQLYQAADVIHKLWLISQELPKGKFDTAKKQIAQKYDEIERELIVRFDKAYVANNRSSMKEIAGILSHFMGYSQCIDVFIDLSQQSAFVGDDIFAHVLPLCETNAKIMEEVFTNPEQVMSKFVLNIYHGKLQEYIKAKLVSCEDPESYLKTLVDLYARTNKLSSDLSAFDMGSDNYFLGKLTKHIFQRYLDSYVTNEVGYLREKSAAVLQRYYESKKHQKRQILSGGIHDLKRNLQVSLVSKTNIHIGPAVEDYGGETFLSEEVAINLLQEAKLAFRRCQMLSKQSDLASNAVQILDILIFYLCTEHIDYALELAVQAIPLPEPKTHPELYFLDVTRQCNAIMHLLERQFCDNLVPMVISTPKHTYCLQRKKYIVEQLEQKLDTGLDRTLTSVIGWTKFILQTEQRKTDFKPESEDNVVVAATPACVKVIKFMNACIDKVGDCLDGKNVETSHLELATRFHRVVYEHLQQFQYSSVGAVCVIYDVNEYGNCVQRLNIPLVKSLFETLNALCNLLVVLPASLKQVCLDNQLAGLDRSIILNFVQLRADYKAAKLGNLLK